MENSKSFLGYKILFEGHGKIFCRNFNDQKPGELPLEISSHLKYRLNFQGFNYYFIKEN